MFFSVGHEPSYIALALIHFAHTEERTDSINWENSYDLDELNQLLVKKYDLVKHDPFNDLNDISPTFNKEWLLKAVDMLVYLNLVTEHEDPFVGKDYSFDRFKCRIFSAEAGAHGELAVKAMDKGRSWLGKALQEILNKDLSVVPSEVKSFPPKSVPAADRIVAINHNSPEFSATESAIANLLEAIRTDNEFGNSDPDIRDQTIADLKATQELLKPEKVNVSKLEAVAWGTFTFLIEKFADGPISELATVAWDSLKILLGLV